MGIFDKLIKRGINAEKQPATSSGGGVRVVQEAPALTLEQPIGVVANNAFHGGHPSAQSEVASSPQHLQNTALTQAQAQLGIQTGTTIFYDNPASTPVVSHQPSANPFERELSGGGRNILVIVPKSNQDVTHIVQNLQNGEACVINLENIPQEEAQRRLDFLSGVICALGGTIRGLDDKKYILTPQGLGVRG